MAVYGIFHKNMIISKTRNGSNETWYTAAPYWNASHTKTWCLQRHHVASYQHVCVLVYNSWPTTKIFISLHSLYVFETLFQLAMSTSIWLDFEYFRTLFSHPVLHILCNCLQTRYITYNPNSNEVGTLCKTNKNRIRD